MKLWLFGGITGTLTSIVFFLSTQILSLDGELELFEFVIALITPGIVAFIIAKVTKSRTVILFIVAYCTLIIPVLGALFGAPNLDIQVIASLALLGLAGGIVWSTPFVLWMYIRHKEASGLLK
jgi:hypothetical protein